MSFSWRRVFSLLVKWGQCGAATVLRVQNCCCSRSTSGLLLFPFMNILFWLFSFSPATLQMLSRHRLSWWQVHMLLLRACWPATTVVLDAVEFYYCFVMDLFCPSVVRAFIFTGVQYVSQLHWVTDSLTPKLGSESVSVTQWLVGLGQPGVRGTLSTIY